MMRSVSSDNEMCNALLDSWRRRDTSACNKTDDSSETVSLSVDDDGNDDSASKDAVKRHQSVNDTLDKYRSK